jgi:hypothetical protein
MAMKYSQRARHTHVLSSTERGSRQDSDAKPVSEGHLPTIERRARESSGHRNKARAEGHSPAAGRGARESSGHRNEASERGVPTLC